MGTTARPPMKWERCPYLGLHDDSGTSLAYASPWNYCYRAAPPASVRVSYQDEACLCPRFVECTVFLASNWGRLPRTLRGKGEEDRLRNRSAEKAARWIILFLVLGLLSLMILFPESILP